MIKSVNVGVRLPGFKSQTCHFSSSVNSDKQIKLSVPLFLICKVVINPHRVVVRVQ